MSESDAAPDIEGLSNEQLDALQERLDERAIERATPEPSPSGRIDPGYFTDSGLSDADWLSPGGEIVDRLMQETKRVEYVDESHGSGEPDGTIRVTLERGDKTRTLEFEGVQWHRAVGYQRLYDQYRAAFGENLADLDERKFGVLQERWTHHHKSTRYAFE